MLFKKVVRTRTGPNMRPDRCADAISKRRKERDVVELQDASGEAGARHGKASA